MSTPQSEQVIDGPEREVEALGQDLGGQPALATAEHGLPDRHRNGAWHGRKLPKNSGDTNRAHRL
jgi:hypothetical protein